MKHKQVTKNIWDMGRFLSFLLLIAITLLVAHSTGFAQTILFQDDFEDGNANEWVLEAGWQVEDDDGNFVLSGTEHASASTGDLSWRNYSLKANVKLLDTDSRVLLNFRYNGCTRYFVNFSHGDISLAKTLPSCAEHPTLEFVGDEWYDINRWYSIEIVGQEGNIKVYLDKVLTIDYTDSEPFLAGPISFETVDNSHVHFDNVVIVSTDDPASQTSWVSTGGPLGGLGYDVRIHPNNKNIMFVTDNLAGVVKSENAGQTWYQSNSGISTRSGPTGDAINIFSLTIDSNDPEIVWAGTNGQGSAFGVFKSTDDGASWTLKTNGISLDGGIGLVFRGFTIQEGNSNIVYAQAEVSTDVSGWAVPRVKGRVYKTIDGGESWQLIWEGNNLARYLIIEPNNPNVLYVSTGIFDREAYDSDYENSIQGGVGILKSFDGGQNWDTINNGLTDLYVGALRMHPTNPQILFAATGCNHDQGTPNRGGLFRTIDGGTTWTKVISNDIMTTVNFSPSNPNIVYAGSAGAFYRSSDGGLTWTQFTNSRNMWGPEGIRAGFPIDVTIDPDDPNVLYVNNYGGGVFRSSDGAETWSEWSKGYTGADVRNLHVPAGDSSIVYVIGRSGPFVSFNYGEDWLGIANGDATYAEWHSITAHPQTPQIVLIADEHMGIILRSTDQGNDFTERLKHPEAGTGVKNQGFKAVAFSTSDPNIVYAGLAKDRNSFLDSSPIGTVIYKSTNAGLTFTPMASIIDGHNVNELVIDSQGANIIYAATSNGVYRSTDGASSWTHFGSLGTRHIEALAIDPDQPGYIIAGELFGGIWLSLDDGISWTGPYNTGFNSANPYISTLVADPKNSNTFFVGDLYSGIYRSQDNGHTWSPFPDWQMSGLTFRAVSDIAINETAIYAATLGGGVFRYDLTLPEIDVKQDEMNLPAGSTYDFGFVEVGMNSTVTFTIENPGERTLELTASPLAQINGEHAGDFEVIQQPSTTVAPGSSTTFDIRFTPQGEGIRTAQISIQNSTHDEDPYEFIVRGGQIRHVAPIGDDNNNDCTDSTNPCGTIQHAIDIATYGDTVMVDEGTYIETITLKAGVSVSGKGAGQSIIDGNRQGTVVTAIGSDITETTIISGFTITGGNGRSQDNFNGGGIYIAGGAFPVIINNTITGNVASSYGGGIYATESLNLRIITHDPLYPEP